MKFLNEHLEACFIVPLMFLMSIIIFVQVVMRYVFHSSLTWSEEMARYLFVWLVYFSVAYTAKKKPISASTLLSISILKKHVLM